MEAYAVSAYRAIVMKRSRVICSTHSALADMHEVQLTEIWCSSPATTFLTLSQYNPYSYLGVCTLSVLTFSSNVSHLVCRSRRSKDCSLEVRLLWRVQPGLHRSRLQSGLAQDLCEAIGFMQRRVCLWNFNMQDVHCCTSSCCRFWAEDGDLQAY